MSLTPDEVEQERGRFEAWIRSAYVGNADLATVRGDYAEMFTWCHWTGWLAAIESERERVSNDQLERHAADSGGDVLGEASKRW